MKYKDAREYINECRLLGGTFDENALENLIIWAYDKGWEEGREDYREEQDPTENQEWRKTR